MDEHAAGGGSVDGALLTQAYRPWRHMVDACEAERPKETDPEPADVELPSLDGEAW